jgi:predicted tellurium resistance membrane protein TerC
MEFLADPAIWASLATLTLLEIVLGIDNVVFISVLVARLPEAEQPRARTLGLLGALVMRVILLFGIVWLTKLTTPVFEAFDLAFSWRDLILMVGGGFLLAKATNEIHHSIEGAGVIERRKSGGAGQFWRVIVQVMLLDVVFSLDSVLTAIGMAQHIEVMIAAVTIAIGVMLWMSGPIAAFIHKHPTTKMLALSFLLLIGMALIADGFSFHIPRGYFYFAIAFSALVEVLNLSFAARRRKRLVKNQAS